VLYRAGVPSLLALTILGLSGREFAIVATIVIIMVAAIARYAYSRRKKYRLGRPRPPLLA
jgi:hypothetical protein